jgi:hypothetical protein
MSPGAAIDYKTLRQVNPEAARQAVLKYLKTNGGNKAVATRVFGVNRTLVHDILNNAAEEDLQYRHKTLTNTIELCNTCMLQARSNLCE